MYELRHLRAFRAIAEELHFGRAARRLHMTQPPLSQLLKQLENAIGEKLLNRTTRTVELTPAGREFLVHARAILEAADKAPLEAKRAASGEAGQLTIGFVPSAAYQFLPRMIRAYRQAYPDVRLYFREMVSTRQFDELGRGKIDIGLVRHPIANRRLESRVVWRESFVVAVPSSHPFGDKDAISIKALDLEPFITYGAEDSTYFSAKVERLLSLHAVRPRIVQRAAIHAILAFVEAGIGIALVAESAKSVSLANIRFLTLTDTQQDDDVELLAAWVKNQQSVLIKNWLAVTGTISRA